MDDEAFASACRADLAGLDRLAEALIRDIASLRMGEAPDMAAIEEHVRTGQRHAADLRRRIGEAAAEVGESVPTWTNRAELEACVDRFAAALARREAELPRRRLQGLAKTLRQRADR